MFAGSPQRWPVIYPDDGKNIDEPRGPVICCVREGAVSTRLGP
jgi:hypothetical protein